MDPTNNRSVYVYDQSLENALKSTELDTRNVPVLGLDTSQLMHIFSSVCMGSPKDFKTLTMVCQTWKTLVSGQAFYNELYSHVVGQIFGRQKWNKYVGDPGEEPRIPLSWLVQFNGSNAFLTLVPETVKITQPDATVVEETLTAESMGKWAHSPKEGHKIKSADGYTEYSWKEAIKENRPIEKTHWVWLSKEVIGWNKNYEDQQRDARARGQGWDVSGLVDTIVTMFTAHVENGERYFEWDSNNSKSTLLRVQEQTMDIRLCVCFTPAGLCIYYRPLNAFAHPRIGVVFARVNSNNWAD